MLDAFLTDAILNKYVVYACAFFAIVLPVLLWKRDSSGARGVDVSAWTSMPPLFKRLWGAGGVLEFVFGAPAAAFFKTRAALYSRQIPASGLPLTAEKIFAFQLLSAFGGCVLGLLFFLVPDMKVSWAVTAVVVLGFVGWTYPAVVFEKYVQWRQNEITRSLPFAIDLIGSAMRAGLEFGAAMRYFEGLKLEGPLTEEFGKVLQQIELGKTRTEALSDMASRVQVESFTSFASVVAYGTEIGASISETLRVQGEELRRARFHLAERKAARAPSLMILPMAVFIMPAVFIIVITPVILKMKASGIGSH